MKYDPQRHHRRSIRLPGYDYTQPGAYFVTLVTHERECLFGEIVDGDIRLNAWGEIARAEWFQTAVVRPYVMLYNNEFVVMPNHVHGIIWIVDDDMNVGARRRRAPTSDAPIAEQFGKPVAGSIPTIIRAYKSAVAKRINALRGTPGAPVWQRNYYEHIIRDEGELERIRQYILDNPALWVRDRENPDVVAIAQWER